MRQIVSIIFMATGILIMTTVMGAAIQDGKYMMAGFIFGSVLVGLILLNDVVRE